MCTVTTERTTTTRSLRSRRARLAGLALLGATFGLAACGGDGDGADLIEPTRTYDVALHVDDSGDDYRYLVTGEVPDFTVGDEVTFVMDNTGALIHDLRVIDPDGVTLATAAAVAPGGVLELTVLLETAGLHALNCVVDDHLLVHGMQQFIDVAAA